MDSTQRTRRSTAARKVEPRLPSLADPEDEAAAMLQEMEEDMQQAASAAVPPPPPPQNTTNQDIMKAIQQLSLTITNVDSNVNGLGQRMTALETLPRQVADAQAEAQAATAGVERINSQMRLYRDHAVQLRAEERKLLLPGAPMLDLYTAGGEKPDAVRAKLQEWLLAYQQEQGAHSVPDISREIGAAEIFKMLLRRGQGGAVTAWQICAKMRCRGDRDLLCTIVGRCAARRADPTWR